MKLLAEVGGEASVDRAGMLECVEELADSVGGGVGGHGGVQKVGVVSVDSVLGLSSPLWERATVGLLGPDRDLQKRLMLRRGMTAQCWSSRVCWWVVGVA